jgi:hypothetical protein
MYSKVVIAFFWWRLLQLALFIYSTTNRKMSSKADYLAKYLTADTLSKKSKKRKRAPAQSEALVIADDDVSGWDAAPKERKEKRDDALIVSGTYSNTELRGGGGTNSFCRTLSRLPQEKSLRLDDRCPGRAGRSRRGRCYSARRGEGAGREGRRGWG